LLIIGILQKILLPNIFMSLIGAGAA